MIQSKQLRTTATYTDPLDLQIGYHIPAGGPLYLCSKHPLKFEWRMSPSQCEFGWEKLDVLSPWSLFAVSSQFDIKLADANYARDRQLSKVLNVNILIMGDEVKC